jgi:putative ABC transport system permease protein
MKVVDALKLALSAIWAHKLRSALTLLGMAVGVAAVVLVVSVIRGFNLYMDDKLTGIGNQSFTISRFSLADHRNTTAMAKAMRRNKDLTLDDYAYLQKYLHMVGAKGAPQVCKIKYGTKIFAVPVSGATANLADIEKREVGEGRYFTQSEYEAAAPVAFIGANVANSLFPTGTALDQSISIDGMSYRVVGIAAAKGSVFGVPQDTFITIPLTDYIRQFGRPIRQRALSFIAIAKPGQRFEEAVAEAYRLMRLRRKLSGKEKDDFGVITPDGITAMRDRILGPIAIAAITVPSIALFVGGIVIMNMMLVSVTERTSEIGLRKACGARRSDIMLQFLAEAVILSSIGGAIGVLIACLGTSLLTAVFFTTHNSIMAVVIALLVAGTVGLLSGAFPAWKAAQLDPVEALRMEA